MTLEAKNPIEHLNGKNKRMDQFMELPLWFHLTPPHGWMNDPCAPGYDPETKLYHIFYQWNPKGIEWGNMSWGHSVSKDLVHWDRVGDRPALKPTSEYDREGVFTGCFHASGMHQEKDQLTTFYTSVNKLPLKFNIPYHFGQESLSYATSTDQGKTWTKGFDNPILSGPPKSIKEMTGWRDPYVQKWESFDKARGVSTDSLYGIISGGSKGVEPNSYIYEIDGNDLSKWNYLGPLVTSLGLNFRPSKKWSGDFGVNWEVTNFMTLKDGTTSQEFLILGAEGGAQRDHLVDMVLPDGLQERTARWGLWMSGDLVKTGDNVQLQYKYGGILDHGVYYAANSFHDPVNNRRVVWGWIPEEDIPVRHLEKRGFNGCMGIMRELFLLTIPNVTGTLRTPLDQLPTIQVIPNDNGTNTLHTLGIRPLREYDNLHGRPVYTSDNLALPAPDFALYETSVQSKRWVLESTIKVKAGCKSVGVVFRHNKEKTVFSSILFDPLEEEIAVNRAQSNNDDTISKCQEKGPHTLFHTDNNSVKSQEKLKLSIFCDDFVVEVFANDRFALSTMIYTDDALGISLMAAGELGSAVFERTTIWEMSHGIF
ncbi:hypothetical protein INT44_003461 [Umbelopsis vinacea]|uniref:Uncharacterized protein n=1 Tax=Umbelopsis vinacea TaxID=44442 RepID=A0A8H7UG58_9FUNG|nr:hypothetical protein INT44_003461 [Umbelopsis vinacea]